MLSADQSRYSTRTLRSLSPSVLARSAAVGVIALLVGTLVAALGFLAVGLTFGGISDSSSGLLGQAMLVNVVLYGASALILVFGVVASALVHARAHSSSGRIVWPAVRDTLRVVPRVAAVMLALVVALVAALFLWLPISVIALVVAAVLYVRHRRAPLGAGAGASRTRTSPGVRRALDLGAGSTAAHCDLPYQAYLDQRRALTDLVARLRQRHAQMLVYHPAQALCDIPRQVCPMTMHGKYLYSYGDHVSDTGNGRMADVLLPLLSRS